MSSAIAAGRYGSSRTGTTSAFRAWLALRRFLVLPAPSRRPLCHTLLRPPTSPTPLTVTSTPAEMRCTAVACRKACGVTCLARTSHAFGSFPESKAIQTANSIKSESEPLRDPRKVRQISKLAGRSAFGPRAEPQRNASSRPEMPKFRNFFVQISGAERQEGLPRLSRQFRCISIRRVWSMSKNGSRATASPRTPMTANAASRIQATTAKANGGAVPKGSFASTAQSVAAKPGNR